MSANNKYTDKEFEKLMQDAFLDLDTGNPENSSLLDEVAKSVYATEWAGVSDRHNAATVSQKNKVAMWAWFLSDVIIIMSVGFFGWNVLRSTDAKAEGTNLAQEKLVNAEAKTPEVSKEEIKKSITEQKAELPVSENKIIQQSSPHKKFNAVDPVVTEMKQLVSSNNVPTQKNKDGNADNKQPEKLASVSLVNNGSAIKGAIQQEETIPTNSITENQNKINEQPVLGDNTEDAAMPVFSEEETNEHFKEKEKFILSFSGMKKTEFTIVEMPGEQSGHRFLKTNEVSNFEYNMFLNDLIIKGKTKEYEIAKHKTDKMFVGKDEMINKVFLNRYLKKNKFEYEHKYKYYPVVCVSVEGMEMYCAWLKEQIEEYYKHNNQQVAVTVRLPKTDEWKTAALNGQPKRKFATYNGKLTDDAAKSKWLANFVQTQNTYVSGDENILLNRSSSNKKMKPATLGKNMFTISSVTEGHEKKNESYSLQNMSGNVSEVVIGSDDENSKKYRTIGGNWNSKKKFLLIQSPDEFNGNTEPSIYVGFRPIVILEP